MLSPEQNRVIEAVRGGRNVFFSGVAGTGKSYTLTSIRELLRSLGRSVAVTAPTGAAAILVGGDTLHSLMGCGGPYELR